MLIVAWQSVQQIAMPTTDRCAPSRPSDSGPAGQADRHHRRAVVGGHPAVGEIARQRVEDQRRDRAETGHQPEVDGLVGGAAGRLDQPRQHVLDRGEERDRGAEVRQHQRGDEGRPGAPGDRGRRSGLRPVGALGRAPGIPALHRIRSGGYRGLALPGNTSRHQSLVHVASGPDEHATTRAGQALPPRRGGNPAPAFRNLSTRIGHWVNGEPSANGDSKDSFILIDFFNSHRNEAIDTLRRHHLRCHYPTDPHRNFRNSPKYFGTRQEEMHETP